MKYVEKMSNKSLDLIQDNINKLNTVFPNLISEGIVDAEMFKLLFGQELNDIKLRYQFTWNGKNETIKKAQLPSTMTLIPRVDKSKKWDTTQNLYLEGDNFEILKLLQKSYYGKIKVIYIDPPYNTGNDFIYIDNFKESLENYKTSTNQNYIKNPETNGRYHTDWLNMIYPRLLLSKNLLKDDGVIFISIDENELENLIKICKEIFGENNYIGSLIWENRTSPNDAKNNFGTIHEYILIIAKNKDKLKFIGETKDFSGYTNPDNDPNGSWIKDNPSAASGNPNKDRFEIINPFTKEKYLPPKGRYWAFSEKRVEEWSKTGKLLFPREKNKNFILKKYRSELKSSYLPFKSIIRNIITSHGTKEIKSIFNDIEDVFKYPKPTSLIKNILEQIDCKDSYILDFFSGSATTAHAVMKLNAEDDGNRKFIMVQLPELLDDNSQAFKNGYKTICDIGIERIRRSGDRIINELKNDGNLFNIADQIDKLDIGFKTFMLDNSNFNTHDSNTNSFEDLLTENTFDLERSKLDILYEIMLKYGYFDKPIETLNINGKNVFSIAMNYMLVIIDEKLDNNDINKIIDLKPEIVIFDERCFKDDSQKMNFDIRLKSAGIKEVKSI